MSHASYSLEAVSETGHAGAEFEVAAVAAWAERTRALGLQRAVTELMLKLDRLAKITVSASCRVDALRALKRPLLKAAVGLPKTIAKDSAGSADTDSLGLEQRLYCLMVKNLKQALRDLDHSAEPFNEALEMRRRWTLRNQVVFLGHQIELGVFLGRKPPPHTWHELHDLFSYLTVRGYIASGSGARKSGRNLGFDAQREYLRLLLLGLADQLLAGRRISSILVDQIAAWAGSSRLVEPEPHVGGFGPYVVEISRDAPPRQVPGALTESFRGWVLEPAKGFVDYLDAMNWGRQSSSRR